MFKKINKIISFPSLMVIRFYQKTISPDHSWVKRFFPYGYCRFHPSCSEYAYQAIDKYGIFKGWGLGLWRIMRCNPWNPGGEDYLK